MKKLFVVLFVSMVALSIAALASAQQREYQGGQSQYDQQRQYGTQDQQQYGRQDRPQYQYGRQDQREQQYGTRAGRQQTAANFSRASDLMDKKVQGRQGEELGEVEDLIITRNGRVAYLIVSRGGVMGMGDEYIPIPFRNARLSPQQDAVILPNVSRQAFENAPTIAKNDWQKLEDPGFEREVFSYYGQPGARGYPQQRGYQQPDPGQYQQQQQQRPMQQQRPGQMGR